MWQSQTQRFGDNLRGRRRAKELAPAARAGTRPAGYLPSVLEGDLALGEAGPNGLNRAQVFPFGRRQCHPARHDGHGQVVHGREGHHHGRQRLVTSGDAEDAPASGEAADKPPEDARRFVAVGETIHHSRRALRPSVAGVRAVPRKRHALQRLKLPGRRLHQQPKLIVSRVIAERDGPAVGPAHPALMAQEKEWLGGHARRLPPHANVLDQPEEVPARCMGENSAAQRQLARSPRSMGHHVVRAVVTTTQNIVQRYRCGHQSVSCRKSHSLPIVPAFASL